jgi:hypothetical protein
MTDEDVIGRLSALFGVKYYKLKQRRESWKVTFMVVVTGRKAVVLMHKLKPFLSRRRQLQIARALATYDPLYGAKARVSTKIDRKALLDIRKRRKKGESLRAIARLYGVHHETIRDRVLKGF